MPTASRRAAVTTAAVIGPPRAWITSIGRDHAPGPCRLAGGLNEQWDCQLRRPVGCAVAASSYRGHWGVAWLGVILGLGMLAIIFLPQMNPNTKLPGSKGSLMVAVGGVAGVLMAFLLVTTIGFTFEGFDLPSLLFLVAVAGGLAMGWFGWQAFQAEGGKFQMGGPRPE